jgi:hypothetical protein
VPHHHTNFCGNARNDLITTTKLAQARNQMGAVWLQLLPSKLEIKKSTQDDINGFYAIYSSTKISQSNWLMTSGV